MQVTLKGIKTEPFLKRMFFVAWNNSSVRGLGMLQDRGEMTEEQVWENVSNMGDYPGDHSGPDNLNADYVFGRMMKLSVRDIKKKTFSMRDENFDSSYQSFARRFKNARELFDATLISMKNDTYNDKEINYEIS